jgi:hypothetical protein
MTSGACFPRLSSTCRFLGQGVLGGVVPVIEVGVGHDDRVDVDDLADRGRQVHQGVGQMAVGGAREPGERPFSPSIGSTRNFRPA